MVGILLSLMAVRRSLLLRCNAVIFKSEVVSLLLSPPRSVLSDQMIPFSLPIESAKFAKIGIYMLEDEKNFPSFKIVIFVYFIHCNLQWFIKRIK